MVINAKEQLEAQYDLLGHTADDITEIRTLPDSRSYFCKGKESYVETAGRLLDRNVYVGINPRNSLVPGTIANIDRVTCLVVDIDPIRPKGAASTDEQHKEACAVGERIVADFPGSVAASSGSGCHVYFPINSIKVVNREVLSDSLKGWSDAVKRKYSTETQKIDSIFDLPRIIRVWSSHNSKSNRVCQVLSPVSQTRFAFEFNQVPKSNESDTVRNGDSISELEQRFIRLCGTNKRLKELSEGTIAPGDEGRSGLDFEFIGILTRSQFTADEIQELMPFNKLGQSKKHGSREEKADIIRSMKKFQEMKDTRAFSLANNHTSYYQTLKNRKMGIRSGFTALDEMISGFKEGKIYIIGARPGTGKTTMMAQILTNMAERGIPCLMFPTEVGAEPIIDKIISRKCKISLKKFQNGTFTEEDASKIESTKDYISSLPLTIYEDFGLDIDRYEEELDKYAPKVVCLDYFQALKWKDSNSVGEKEEAVRRIKKITKDRNIVTICASQLTRSKGEGKVNMAELKGTGALEEYADVIGQMYTVDTIGYPIPVDMVISKSKYSATGSINFKFDKTNATFIEEENQ